MRIPLDIPPGLVSDDTSFTSAGRYEDASNVRFWRGKPQTIGGWSAMATGIEGKCRTILSWSDNHGVVNVGLGTHSKLYVFVGGTLADVTPAALSAGNEDSVGGPGFGADTYNSGSFGTIRTNYYARTWSLSTYGETLIANPRLGRIYQWTNDAGVAAVPVPNAPATVTFTLVTPERQIVAFGCNEEVGGSFNPLCIRWSDIENIGVWTTSSANNAGEQILEGGGRIVAARLFGNGIAVWTDNAVYSMQFVGDPGQTFRVDRIEENCGLIGPNAVAIINQAAYWMAPDGQPRVWALGAPPQILPCPIRSDFADHAAEAQGDKVVAATLSRFGEVWFHYPDGRDGSGSENSRYLIYNTLENVWSRGRIARTAACDSGVVGYPLMVSPGGELFLHEFGNNANGANLEWHLTTSDQYLDEGGRRMFVKSVEPDFEDQEGAISLTLNSREYPQGPQTMHGPFALADGGNKRDFRASGKVFAMRFEGASNPSYMRAGKPVFDVSVGGRR